MKNPKTRQPDPVSGTVAHDGVDKPMNNNLGTDDVELNEPNDQSDGQQDDDSVANVLTNTDTPNLKNSL